MDSHRQRPGRRYYKRPFAFSGEERNPRRPPLRSPSSEVERHQRRIYYSHRHPFIERRYGDYYGDASDSTYFYDDGYPLPHSSSIEERQSYGGGGGYSTSTGCCGSSKSSSLSTILKYLLLAILIPMALLLSLTILFLFATALRTYTSCLLGNNVTVSGVIYNCGGLFGGFGGLSVITVGQQQQQVQYNLINNWIPNERFNCRLYLLPWSSNNSSNSKTPTLTPTRITIRPQLLQ